MSSQSADHWQAVYQDRAADSVSWYRPGAGDSLAALERAGADASAGLIDVGGGASTLVDELLERGWRDLAVLDIAEAPQDQARARLGKAAESVDWIVADVTRWSPARRYGCWHDRAVLHFLNDEAGKAAYRRAVSAAVSPGGVAVIGAFAPDGPDRCSGLPVSRYDGEGLFAVLGDAFDLLDHWRGDHVTPQGVIQPFTWIAARRR